MNDKAPREAAAPKRRGRRPIPGVRSAASFTIKQVGWLWHPYLALGKITLLDGDPGRAKSMLTLNWVAHIALGLPLPNRAVVVGRRNRPRGAVVVCTEDDWEDTVLPRLLATIKTLDPRITPAGLRNAQRRVAAVFPVEDDDGKLQPFQIPRDIDRLARAVRRVNAALVVIDPIMAYLGDDVNPYIDPSIRTGLTPLQRMAEELNVATVLIRHFNKDIKARVAARGGGSLGGFLGLARCGLVVDYHPDTRGVLVLANYKNNLARPGEAISYTVEPYTLEHDGLTVDTVYVQWGDFEGDMDADNLIRGRDSRKEAPVLAACMAAIGQLLDERDPYPAEKIKELLEKEFRPSTVHKAKDKLRVRSVVAARDEHGYISKWDWTRKPAEEES